MERIMLMTRGMERDGIKGEVDIEAATLFRRERMQRAQYAAIELRSLEVIKENETSNRFFRKTMIDSDVACRMSFHSYSASEKLQIMTDMQREFGISYEDGEKR